MSRLSATLTSRGAIDVLSDMRSAYLSQDTTRTVTLGTVLVVVFLDYLLPT